jgi:hypothetical protein
METTLLKIKRRKLTPMATVDVYVSADTRIPDGQILFKKLLQHLPAFCYATKEEAGKSTPYRNYGNSKFTTRHLVLTIKQVE